MPAPTWPETLADGEIAVWFQRLDPHAPHALPRPPACLDAGELDRWARLRRPADRALFGAAHALLRVTLSRYAAIAADEWRFHCPPGHRPELAGAGTGTGLRFSLTHTRGLCACAVARGLAPGLDAERREPIFAPELVTPPFFHPAELAALAALPPAHRGTALFDLWTLKEAYVKARGIGMALPFDRFVAHRTPPAYCPDPEAPPGAPWHAFLLTVGASHSLALAVQGAAPLTVTLREA